MFLLLCFVSCVNGRTCGQTPLLAIYAIKYVYTNIPFRILLGGAKSHIQAEIQNMKDKRRKSNTRNTKSKTQNKEDKIKKTKVTSATKKNKEKEC